MLNRSLTLLLAEDRADTLSGRHQVPFVQGEYTKRFPGSLDRHSAAVRDYQNKLSSQRLNLGPNSITKENFEEFHLGLNLSYFNITLQKKGDPTLREGELVYDESKKYFCFKDDSTEYVVDGGDTVIIILNPKDSGIKEGACFKIQPNSQ